MVFLLVFYYVSGGLQAAPPARVALTQPTIVAMPSMKGCEIILNQMESDEELDIDRTNSKCETVY